LWFILLLSLPVLSTASMEERLVNEESERISKAAIVANCCNIRQFAWTE